MQRLNLCVQDVTVMQKSEEHGHSHQSPHPEQMRQADSGLQVISMPQHACAGH